MSAEVEKKSGSVGAIAIPGELLSVFSPPVAFDDLWAVTIQGWRVSGMDSTADGRIKCIRYMRDGKRPDEEFLHDNKVMAENIGHYIATQTIVVTTVEKSDAFLNGPRFV